MCKINTIGCLIHFSFLILPFGLKWQCSAFNKTWTDTIYQGGPDCREEQLGTSCSPINAPQDHDMHPRGFTASAKSCL